MKTASSILQAVAGITGLTLVVLGVLFWMGRAYQLLPLHMILGVVFVLALWTEAALAARAGAPRGQVAFAVLLGIVMPVFGMAQASILPGPYHWTIRVLHLLVGIVGMRLVGVLGMQVKRGLQVAAGSPPAVGEGRATA